MLVVKRVFVTSSEGTGQFSSWSETSQDGLAGGDEICQAHADAASLGGTWTAWLSTSSTDAKDRITDQAYFLVDGETKVCDNKADLIDGSIDHPINLTEINTETTSDNYAWTGTNADGRAGGSNCTNWTAITPEWLQGRDGHTTEANSRWTYCDEYNCSNSNERLYCFED